MTLGSGPWHWHVWAGIDAASFRPTKSRLTATRAGRRLHGLGCSRPATVSAGLKTQAHTTRQDTVLHSLPFRKKEKKVVHLFPPQSSESDSVYLVHSHRRLGTPLRPRSGNATLCRVQLQNSKFQIFFRHLHGDLNLDEIKNTLRLLSVNGETNLMNLIRL